MYHIIISSSGTAADTCFLGRGQNSQAQGLGCVASKDSFIHDPYHTHASTGGGLIERPREKHLGQSQLELWGIARPGFLSRLQQRLLQGPCAHTLLQAPTTSYKAVKARAQRYLPTKRAPGPATGLQVAACPTIGSRARILLLGASPDLIAGPKGSKGHVGVQSGPRACTAALRQHTWPRWAKVSRRASGPTSGLRSPARFGPRQCFGGRQSAQHE